MVPHDSPKHPRARDRLLQGQTKLGAKFTPPMQRISVIKGSTGQELPVPSRGRSRVLYEQVKGPRSTPSVPAGNVDKSRHSSGCDQADVPLRSSVRNMVREQLVCPW